MMLDVMVFLLVKSRQSFLPQVQPSAKAKQLRRLSFAFIKKEDFLLVLTPVTPKSKKYFEKYQSKDSLRPRQCHTTVCPQDQTKPKCPDIQELSGCSYNQQDRGMRRKRGEGSGRKMKISVPRRLKLIDLVVNQGYSVVRAARKLEIKGFTARSIVNKYRKEGLVYDHRQRMFITPPPVQRKRELEPHKMVKEEEMYHHSSPQQEQKPTMHEIKQEASDQFPEQKVLIEAKEEDANGIYLFYH